MDTQTQEKPDYIKDVSEATFLADVIEASKTAPVIVDFWAPWCGPCRQLMPMLEKLVTAEGGAVRLAKVNSDDNPGISQQMQVRSLPTVYAFVDGKPVDGFMGAQPESELKKFIGKLTGATDVVAEAKALVERAQESLKAGDNGGAAQDFAEALQMNEESAEARAGLARIYLEGGAPEQAQSLMVDLPDSVKNHPEITGVIAALSLIGDAPSPQDAVEENPAAALLSKVEANPDDLDARLDLAKALAANNQNAAAVDHLIYAVGKNRAHDDEAARKFLLTIFEAEGVESPVAIDGRKRLASILFA